MSMKKNESNGCFALILACVVYLILALAFIPCIVMFILLLPFGINTFEILSKIGRWGKKETDSFQISQFISNYNYNNSTNYIVNTIKVDLYQEFSECMIHYLTTQKSIITTTIEPCGYITLFNYNYRYIEKRPKNCIHKLNTCNLKGLVNAVETNNIKLFYNSLFSIPIHTFSLENKISIAQNIKNKSYVNIVILTRYLDTNELWSNTFILENGVLSMKTRDLGCVSDYD